MESTAFNPFVCRTRVAPFTRRLLGNSIALLCERYTVRQGNYLNFSAFGLESPFTTDILRASRKAKIIAELQQKVERREGSNAIEHLLVYLKKVDMKFALLFTLKRDELRQVLGGDTEILETCLKTAAEDPGLKDGNYCIIPNAELCKIMEKLRLMMNNTGAGAAGIAESEGAAAVESSMRVVEMFRNSWHEYCNATTSTSTNSVAGGGSGGGTSCGVSCGGASASSSVDGGFGQPNKYLSTRKPILCDASTQYEHFHGCSEGCPETSQLPVECIKKNETKIAARKKGLIENDYTFRKCSLYQPYQLSCLDNLIGPGSNSKILLSTAEAQNKHMPEDSIVLLRKKIIAKELALKKSSEMVAINAPEPTFNDIFFNNKGSSEWLSEETEPDDFEFPSDEDCDNIASDLDIKQAEPNLESVTNAVHNDVQLSCCVKCPNYLQDEENETHSYSSSNSISDSSQRTIVVVPYSTQKTNVHVPRTTKIPIPIDRKLHFQRLLENTDAMDSEKKKFFDIQAIDNANDQHRHTEMEGYGTEAERALDKNGKFHFKGSTESFEQSVRRDFENAHDILAIKPTETFIKQGASISFNDTLEENKGSRDRKNGKFETISKKLQKKPILSRSISNIRRSYDDKQRGLVELIARGVEQEMLLNLGNNKYHQNKANKHETEENNN